MILTGGKIHEEVLNKNIIINPFSSDQVSPNSYDFRLGETLLTYRAKTLDAKKNNETEKITIPKEGIILMPNKLYLGHTYEEMGSNKFVPIIRGRSSTGRLGLFINITADLIDIGSINQWTLQLHTVQPLRVYPNMLIGQVTFWEPEGQIDLYNGKYQGSIGPVASKLYRDFSQKDI